jgi:aspartyl-tRNA(Asn)/glutamyl-tRNA(Gln) amidotransferase subunit A
VKAEGEAREALDVPLLECARGIHGGAVSPVALAEAALERIERVGPTLNCFVTITADVALREAREAERELRRGRHLGPLHGIPYGLKDNIDTAGIRTTWGARPYADRVPERDATVVERLRSAGAVHVGKLALTELAGGFNPRWAHASINGACRNPWDRSRSAGGSSSGAAAAVAARLVFFALGTESLGSLMNPAAYCGVTALRPTYGAVSKHGVLPFAHTLDKVGPMCRTALDCGAVLASLAVPDPLDPVSIPSPPGLHHVDPAAAVGLRAAALDLPTTFPVPPEIDVFYEEAIDAFRAAGIRVEPAAIPALPWREVGDLIAMAETELAFEDLIRSGRTRELVDPNRPREVPGSAADYVRAMAVRGEMQRQMHEFFRKYDLILSANNPILPPPLDQPIPAMGGDAMRYAGNLLGLPAAAVPIGFAQPGKLPVGLSIVGRPMEDARVLAAAALYQSRTRWHLEHPPVET